MNIERWMRWRDAFRAFLASDRGKFLLRGLRFLVGIGVVLFLVYQLNRIGWADVWQALPTTPWFYVVALSMYFLLPITETLVYGITWQVPFRKSLPALLKKRVYNSEVLNYSGEVYLYSWAKEHVDRPDWTILGTIKDNAIVSSITSVVSAISLLVVVLVSGLIPWATLFGGEHRWYIGAGFGFGVILVALILRFRKKMFFLPVRTLKILFGLHAARFVLMIYVLQVLLWWTVLPEVPIRTWVVFLTVKVLINRLPFLPSRDLIFAGLSVELAELTALSGAAVAGMVLVRTALDKILNLVLYLLTTWKEKTGSDPDPVKEPGERSRP